MSWSEAKQKGRSIEVHLEDRSDPTAGLFIETTRYVPANGYLNKPDAAAALGVSRQTVYRWLESGKLKQNEDELIPVTEVKRFLTHGRSDDLREHPNRFIALLRNRVAHQPADKDPGPALFYYLHSYLARDLLADTHADPDQASLFERRVLEAVSQARGGGESATGDSDAE